MTNTIFENQGNTSVSIKANQTGSILFQDCQFFVNTAIDITSEASNLTAGPQISIQLENCFISKTAQHPRSISDNFVEHNTRVLLKVLNVTIYTNNTYDTYDGEFDCDIDVNETCFISGNNLKRVFHDKIKFNILRQNLHQTCFNDFSNVKWYMKQSAI